MCYFVNMRLLLVIICLIQVSCSVNQTKTISYANDLKIRQIGQYTCWAATLEALSKVNGKKVSQKELVQLYALAAYKTILDKEQFERFKDDRLASLDFRTAISIFGLGNKPISKESIENEINNDNPVVYLANNHTSIIVGYNQDRYLVMDTNLGEIVEFSKLQFTFISADPRAGLSLFFSVPKLKNNNVVLTNNQILK